MKLILTDEDGVEAARKACRTTADVTEIEAKSLAAIVVRVAPRNAFAWDRSSFDAAAREELRRLMPRGEAPVFIVVEGDAEIEALDEKTMRAAGWVRSRPARSGS